jgi:hypothetical protein
MPKLAGINQQRAVKAMAGIVKDSGLTTEKFNELL